jgi:hypothetical protein
MKKQSVRVLYNEISQKYNDNRSFALNDYTELPIVIKLAGDVKDKQILDSGC